MVEKGKKSRWDCGTFVECECFFFIIHPIFVHSLQIPVELLTGGILLFIAAGVFYV